ncbi:unnamed protein product, partial [Cyprideis torosa]
MNEVSQIKDGGAYYFLDTGSPHHVILVEDVQSIDVKKQGAAIRHSPLYGEAGTNVNFVQILDDENIIVRTYERGVEDETLACGTGVTAAAIAVHHAQRTEKELIQ